MRVTDSGTPNQHFYPHCTACSNKQGQVLGNGSRGPLVLHRLGVPPGPLPGARMVGQAGLGWAGLGWGDCAHPGQASSQMQAAGSWLEQLQGHQQDQQD